jgi:hypothetical protein
VVIAVQFNAEKLVTKLISGVRYIDRRFVNEFQLLHGMGNYAVLYFPAERKNENYFETLLIDKT